MLEFEPLKRATAREMLSNASRWNFTSETAPALEAKSSPQSSESGDEHGQGDIDSDGSSSRGLPSVEESGPEMLPPSAADIASNPPQVDFAECTQNLTV
ncbi:MAG: hypothetical protein SGPRY_011246, partial [Prymnesium sp.]